jgi:hypothetical protein
VSSLPCAVTRASSLLISVVSDDVETDTVSICCSVVQPARHRRQSAHVVNARAELHMQGHLRSGDLTNNGGRLTNNRLIFVRIRMTGMATDESHRQQGVTARGGGAGAGPVTRMADRQLD